jgi:HlyD family secretion protein
VQLVRKGELDRIEAKARSELAKAESQRTSKGLALKKEEEKLVKLAEQIEYCTVVATQPGLVVYAGGRDWDERIAEGMEVRERQTLITIPNTASMLVRTQVHESVVARVHEGLKVNITVDALPGRMLEGKVEKVWVLPDTENRWLNPNLKVYRTDISIEGDNHLDLKPGMSVQVRIIIDELKDVLSIPLQAITTRGDEQFVFVMTPSGPKRQVVRIGDYNDKLIQVTEGLKEGETVILDVADLVEAYKPPETKKGTAPEQDERPVAAEKGRGSDAGRRSS